MRTVKCGRFRASIDECLADAASGEVIVTNGGKPWLVLRSITEEAVDSAAFAHSPEFWQMIRQRRQENGIPWEEAGRDLDLDQS